MAAKLATGCSYVEQTRLVVRMDVASCQSLQSTRILYYRPSSLVVRHYVIYEEMGNSEHGINRVTWGLHNCPM